MAELVIPFDEEEEEEEEDPSNFIDELARFRALWHSELQAGSNDSQEIDKEAGQRKTIEDQAEYFFMLGVKSEQSGQLYDAIQYYRRAVQLVPDIEFKVDYQVPRRERMESESSIDSIATDTEDDQEDISNLLERFHRLKVTETTICHADDGQDINQTHLSILPIELLNYIFKWVVSSDLDIVSLENLAVVCRGFYICARDEEVWRLICERVWGGNCGRPKSYGSWRNMYIDRPHVRFDGCYISKMTYYRQGEKGLDNFYKPFHLVEYYRYIRFFPEGQMFMLTTPDDPYAVVQKLKGHGCNMHGILHGYYKMAGQHVTAVLKRRKSDYRPVISSYYHYKRRQQNQKQNENEQSFHVEFEIQNSGRRPHARLMWTHYSIHTRYINSQDDEDIVTEFELNNDKFPPMIFSRVRSYTGFSEVPLK